jgi:hypothetical protein
VRIQGSFGDGSVTAASMGCESIPPRRWGQAASHDASFS